MGFVHTHLIPEKTKSAEGGCSMPEMLGVLAIIGVLSVSGIAGYRHGITKHRANITLNDSRMAYMESKTRQSVPDHAWQDVSFFILSFVGFG